MSAWEKIYSKGIEIKDIAENSSEYQAMWDAAVANFASAQYCFAIWLMLFDKLPDAMTNWMRRAAEQNFAPAVDAYKKIQNGEALDDLSTFCREGQDTTPRQDVVIHTDSGDIVIKRQNFDIEQSNLKKLAEEAKKEISIHQVQKKKWSFSNSAKIEDVNVAISDIQSHFFKMKAINQEMIDQFGVVHKIFAALDSEYLSGIVAAIKSAEKVSKEERKDRAAIKELVARHTEAVKSLNEFKNDLEKLKHLNEIDKAWELIETQSKNLKKCSDYISELSKMEHIKDVDRLWGNLEKHGQTLTEFKLLLQNIQKAQEQFINNAKQLITDAQNDLTKQMESFSDAQFTKLNEIDRHYSEAFEQLRNEQKQILDTIRTSLNEKIDAALTKQDETLSRIEQTQKEEFQKLFEGQAIQTEKIQDIDKHYSEAVEQLSNEQKAALVAIDKSLSDKLDTAVGKQDETLDRIEQVQKEEFQKLFDEQDSQTKKIEDIDRHYSEAVDNLKDEQNEKLDEIERSQIAKLEEINKSLEEEKAQLNEQVSTLTTKVKYLYYVAGGAASFTIIQLILNIFGVI